MTEQQPPTRSSASPLPLPRRGPDDGAPAESGQPHRQVFVDASLAVGLVAVLGLILLLDRSRPGSGTEAAAEGEGPSIEVIEEPAAPPALASPLRLALTPPKYDDVGRLLSGLGDGYRYDDIAMDDLLEPERLKPYDVVFVTCGYVPRHWGRARLRDTDRGDGGGQYAAETETIERLRESLRQYVGQGGTLYVSDWHFHLLRVAFPELIDWDRVGTGDAGRVTAEVVEEGLRKRLGPTVELNFDKPAWRPAALKGPNVTTYLRGTYDLREGGRTTGPLLVQFPHGDGQVIFTSFHNEKQNSETEKELLKYLVFTTVTAETDARVKRTLVRSGFSPVDRSLFSASPENPSLSQTYDCEGGEELQFVLGFENRGAELSLVVEGPRGRRFEERGTSTLTLDVPDAAAGKWRYTITPVRVPYENFPFSLTIGSKR